jgi:hypothetical protein
MPNPKSETRNPNQIRSPKSETGRFGLRISGLIRIYGFGLLVSVLSGCSDNRSVEAERRHEDLLRNPFGYNQDDTTDVSGGDIHKLDRDALKKDVSNVFNP